MLRFAKLAFAFSLFSATVATAYEIKPIQPEAGFPEEFNTDILGLAIGMPADAALLTLQERVPGIGLKEGRFVFPQTDVTFLSSISNHPYRTTNGSTESFIVRASSPASGNQAYVVYRHVIFSRDEPPTIESIMLALVGKYGVPSALNGNGVFVWAFRDGERLGLPEETAANVIADPTQIRERLSELPQEQSMSAMMFPLISCATHAAIWDASTDRRIGNTRNQPCDAYLYVKILEDRTLEGRAVNMTIAAADLRLRLSSAEIDNNALSEAEAERQGGVAASEAPEL